FLFPDYLGLTEHVFDKQLLLVFGLSLGGIDWAAPLLLLLLLKLLEKSLRIASQKHHDHDEHQHADSAADHHRPPHSAAILDVLASGSLLPAHGCPLHLRVIDAALSTAHHHARAT